jgi:inward rectifier potassium channel
MTSPESSGGSRDPDRDLGFGSVVARESRRRLLNRDGSFNVRRAGLRLLESLSPYHQLLGMRWGPFLGLLSAVYLVTNCLFALGYLACGPGALVHPFTEGTGIPFLDAFFFSVQTFATIGYGSIHPVGIPANLMVTMESLVGLVMIAISTGLMFARFSLPRARIRFSHHAVVAPFQGGTALMFRAANERRSELIGVECEVLFSRFESQKGNRQRNFYRLPLERDRVTFFTLSWTVVHPISGTSPLLGETAETLVESQAELLVVLKGIDDALGQSVMIRTSYTAEEIRWGERFVSVFNSPEPDGTLSVDIRRLSDTEPA